MEVSPLDLRSLTVLPRALLEVSAEAPVGRRRQQQQQLLYLNATVFIHDEWLHAVKASSPWGELLYKELPV